MPAKGRNSPTSKPSNKPTHSRRSFTSAAAPSKGESTATNQQPGLLKEMAATAGAVAVGSAVGHAVGHAVTGMMSGESSKEVRHQQYIESSAPCMSEIQQFAQCALKETDMTTCEELLQAIRNCKLQQQ